MNQLLPVIIITALLAGIGTGAEQETVVSAGDSLVQAPPDSVADHTHDLSLGALFDQPGLIDLARFVESHHQSGESKRWRIEFDARQSLYRTLAPYTRRPPIRVDFEVGRDYLNDGAIKSLHGIDHSRWEYYSFGTYCGCR